MWGEEPPLFLADSNPAQIVRFDLLDGFRRVVRAIVANRFSYRAIFRDDGIGRNVSASAQRWQDQERY